MDNTQNNDKITEFVNDLVYSMEIRKKTIHFANDSKRSECIKDLCDRKEIKESFENVNNLQIGAKHGNIGCSFALGIRYYYQKDYTKMIKYLEPVSDYGVVIATQMMYDCFVSCKRQYKANEYYEKLYSYGNYAHINISNYKHILNNKLIISNYWCEQELMCDNVKNNEKHDEYNEYNEQFKIASVQERVDEKISEKVNKGNDDINQQSIKYGACGCMCIIM